jgi:hypothetical protein
MPRRRHDETGLGPSVVAGGGREWSGMEVRILAPSIALDLVFPMGDGPAVLTGGLGGWTAIQRADDVSITDWEGQEPLTQDVPLMLDGYGEGESVEPLLASLIKLGRPGDSSRPPVFRVKGPIFFPHLHWVLPEGGIDLDEDSAIRGDGGTLLRQALTLHLLEYVRPDRIKSHKRKRKQSERGDPAKTGGTAFPGRIYVTKKGDTLITVAHNLYGDWQQWKAIGAKNHIADPHRKLPAGTRLRLP